MTQFDALIVSHGQPSDPEPAEAALAELAARVQQSLPLLHLGAATMANPGRLESQLAEVVPGGLVYPLFMSDGWFVRTALTKRLGTAPVSVAPPFGIEAALPELVAARMGSLIPAESRHLLLVAHGSASGREAPARAARDFAHQLEQNIPGLSVSVGFLEQSPGIAEFAQTLPADTPCLPFFAMAGDHVRLDLKGELQRAGLNGPILPVISQFEGIGALIGGSIQQQIDESRPVLRRAQG